MDAIEKAFASKSFRLQLSTILYFTIENLRDYAIFYMRVCRGMGPEQQTPHLPRTSLVGRAANN